MRTFAVSLFAVVIVSAVAVAGPLGNMRKRAEDRRDDRKPKAEVVVTKDGTPAIKWDNGSMSPVGKDKEGKLIAAPRSEKPRVIRQSNGSDIRIVPGAKVN